MTQHSTLPPDHDRDFHQLTGAFDQPVAPSPAFAERLKQRFAETPHEKGAPTMHAAQAAPPRATRMTAGRVIPLPDQGNRLVRILEATAAAVLILVLVGGGFFLNRDSNGPGDDPIRLAAVTGTTTPEPDATPAPTASAWTDPGHTNAYPAGFDPETAQPAEPLGDLNIKSDAGIIVGDTLILTGIPAGANPADTPFPTLSGVDLASGEQLWSEQRRIARAPVAGQDAFFTVEMSAPVEGAVTIKLVSTSPLTGLANWERSLLQVKEGALSSSTDLSLVIGSPIAIEDRVYVADGIGDIRAFDTTTGEIIWQAGDFDFTEQLAGAPFGALVGNDDVLFVVNYRNEIVKHDAITGDVIDTFALGEHPPNQRDRLWLYLSGNRLIVFALTPVVVFSDTNHDAGPNVSALLQVLDSESGDALWATNLNGYPAGSLVATNEVIGVPQQYSADATPATANNTFRFIVTFFDLETGDLVSEYGPTPSHEASASASGSVVCIHETSSAVTCADFDKTNPTLHGLDISAPYEAEGPPSPILFWHDSAIVLGHRDGPYIIHSGEAMPEASAHPTASPSPRQRIMPREGLNARPTWSRRPRMRPLPSHLPSTAHR